MSPSTALNSEDICPYYVADVFTTERLRCILPKNHELIGKLEHIIEQKKFMKGK